MRWRSGHSALCVETLLVPSERRFFLASEFPSTQNCPKPIVAAVNRLSKNRALHLFLVVLMQFALLPGQGRIGCVLGSAGLSCCCAKAPAPAEGDVRHAKGGHGCCGQSKVSARETPLVDEQGGEGRGPCTCHDGSGETPFPVSPDTRSTEDHRDLDVALATGSLQNLGSSAFQCVALRLVSRARTGPPLHVWNQIYLI